MDVGIVGSRGYPSTYGGFETFVRHFAPYLAEAGDSVTVYCREGPPGVSQVGGVRCVRTKGLNTNELSTLTFGLTATARAIQEHHDAVLVMNVANGFFLWRFRRANIPVALNVDGVEWERAKWNAVAKAIFHVGARLSARWANTLIADSQEIASLWANEFARPLVYIPYGADNLDGTGTDKVEELGLAPSSYVLAVARMVPENNVQLFLAATDRIDSRVQIVVVGDGPDSALLEAVRRRAKTDPHRFHWLGHVADQELLTQLWCHCAAYFHGHSVGGTNPALLQAMGAGAPVVALDTPYNREVLPFSEQLVRNDVDAATKIDRCVGSSETRRLWASRQRDIVRLKYSWTDVLAAYRATLEELIAQGKCNGKRTSGETSWRRYAEADATRESNGGPNAPGS